MAETTNTSSSPSVQDPALVEGISNPLFLRHAENPGAMLMSKPLIGENYHAWVRSMKKALVAKNKFGFVNGSITLSSPLIKTPAAVDEGCITLNLSEHNLQGYCSRNLE